MRTTQYSLIAGLSALALCAAGAEWHVSASHPAADDGNPGTLERPLRTAAAGVEKARAGDTILLGDGDYSALRIGGAFTPPLTLAAAPNAKPRLLGALDLSGASGIRVRGVAFSWPAEASVGNMTPFIQLAGARDIEISDCAISDRPDRTEWRGMAANVSRASDIVMRNLTIRHVYFGVNVEFSERVTLEKLDVRLWTHEDGIRVRECAGPILIDGCYLTNAGVAGRKGGHVDAIQVVYGSDNLTIRNCHIHGVAQAIGAFSDSRAAPDQRRRRNWRVEGNLIYDVYTPHHATVVGADGVVVVNNTYPQGAARLLRCTGVIVKNNIFGEAAGNIEGLSEAGHNLWLVGSTKLAPTDITGADVRFVNAETALFRMDWGKRADCTETRLYPRGAAGRLKVGDRIEVFLSDGSGRDGILREITAVDGDAIDIAPPLSAKPGPLGAIVYVWPEGLENRRPDYRLRPDSPAIDSADGSVERGKDLAGHEPFDDPDVPNTGVGRVPYLDRGALEYVPPPR